MVSAKSRYQILDRFDPIATDKREKLIAGRTKLKGEGEAEESRENAVAFSGLEQGILPETVSTKEELAAMCGVEDLKRVG